MQRGGNDRLKELVMLNPFGFAQAKLREASRSLNARVPSTWNRGLT